MKKNEILKLSIEKLAYKGKGVGKYNNYVVFVPFAVPGDKVLVQIKKKKKHYAEGVIKELLEPSSLRIKPLCTYFGFCGGCKWQNIPYEYQLEVKKNIVQESLNHIAGLDVEVRNTMASPNQFHYRNKMEFSFSSNRWLLPEELEDKSISKKNALGFHVPGAFNKIMDIHYCYLQSELLNQILTDVRDFALHNDISFYNIQNHVGLLRFLVLRQTRFTDEIMVNVITNAPAREILQPLARMLINKYRNIVSVINGIHEGVSQVAFTDVYEVLEGRDYIMEQLGNYRFKISPNSFFQTNSEQAFRLYKVVEQFAGLSGNEIVWDLYGGTGTIGIMLSGKSKRVKTIELVDAAVRDGMENAKINNVDNVDFVQGDLKETILSLKETPDVVITDPPRDGMHPAVVKSLLQRKPQRIVYVSCNPTTLARDLQILKEQYTIKIVQPVDMFPQTYHIETVVLLELKNA